MRPVRSRTSGFTLMEILVVTFIIATLVALLFPAIQTIQARVNEQVCRVNLKNIGTALQDYLTQFSNFLPVHREKTDGTWYPGIVMVGPQTGYSWQQILDKLLQADNEAGYLYTTGEYTEISGGVAALVNLRGRAGIWRCPVSGYGRGIYMGNYTVFTRRFFPKQTVPHTGPLCVERIIEAAGDGQFSKIPVVADGSLANSDDSWVSRFNQPQKVLDKQGNPGTFNTIHTTVNGSFLHLPTAGKDAGKEFMNVDFRHRGRAQVLFLGWNIAPWERPPEGPLEKANPTSRFNSYRNTWDSMFFRGVNATP